MNENVAELTSDIVLICDTGLFESKTPAIVTMLRGLLGEEIKITGPNKDLHSGMYGGAAMNPARVLSKILASLHDDQGASRCQISMMVCMTLPDAVAEQWRDLNFDHAAFLGDVGLADPAGEEGRSALENDLVAPNVRNQRHDQRIYGRRV